MSEYTEVFKALSDETRLNILSMLAKEEQCAYHLLEKVDISQPTLSYHMKMLTKTGLVLSRKEGNWVRYSLNRDALDNINAFISNIQK